MVTTTVPSSSQSILNLNTHVIENNASGLLEFDPTKSTSISGGGNSILLRYPNGDGLDTNTLSANATVIHTLNGRDSLTATYLYSNFTYPGYLVTFETNSGLIGFVHKWTRNLTTNLSAGPELLYQFCCAQLTGRHRRCDYPVSFAVQLLRLEL